MKKLCSLIFCLFGAFLSYSQTLESVPGPIIVCPAGIGHEHHHTPADDWIIESILQHSTAKSSGTSCANIQVTYNGFTTEAQTAFQAAVDIWENALSSPVTIKITANWTVLGDGVLGSAGAESYWRNFDNAPDDQYYPSALADKIAGEDIDPGFPDIVANFNSNFDWYYGTDGNPPFDEYDLVSVVLHEIGHGLGFASSKNLNEGTGVGSLGLGPQDVPIKYDEFLTDGDGGTPLINFANGVTLGNIFTSNDVYNNSPEAITANGGNSPQIYAPADYAGGSSISHWDESAFPAGNAQSLMTPQIGNGEAIHNPGSITLGLFEDMGWTLCDNGGGGSDCEITPLVLDGPESICPGETTTVEVLSTPQVPDGGGIAIEFLDLSGNDNSVNLTGVELPYTFDNDLNGVLSANDFPVFEGEYELTVFVYEDVADLAGSTCATAASSVTVFFLESSAPACNGEACSIESLDLDGPSSICPGETTTVEVSSPAEVPVGGGIAISFLDLSGNNNSVNLTGVTLPYTFDNDLNGVLSANDFPLFEGEFELTVFVYENVADLAGTTCATGDVPVTVFFLTEDDPACSGSSDPCEDWVDPSPTTGWIDFNNEFGGAPCDDGSGCPFNEIQNFEVFAGEAYSVDNYLAGGTYTFSMCNGPGAGSWTPEFTIIAPSGIIDAFGPGDGCSITWTATEDGTYLIVINEDGNCGVANAIGNGYPALTCADGTANCNGDDPCSISSLDLDGPESICPGETTTVDIPVPANVPVGGGIAISFLDLSGNDNSVNLTGVELPYTFDNDLNGVLSANDFPLFEGEFELTVFVYENVADLEGSTCATGDVPVTVFFLTEDDPACSGSSDPCEDWVDPSPTTGWIDFNNEFGGAPCDDGSGCPFNEIQNFEVFAGEAYSVDNFLAGGTYTFSMCNGPGAGSWTPEFTIIAPSGNIDAFGPGDGCSITWTATEDGTYLIVINEAGNCGVANAIGNGYPALTCADGTANCDGDDPCSISSLELDGPESICPGETTTVDIPVPANVPVGGGIAISFLDLSGNDNSVNLTGVELPYTFDNDLNGVLSANDFPLFEGEFELTVFVYENVADLEGSTCATGDVPVTVFFLTEDDPACGGSSEPCEEWVDPSPTTGWVDFNNEFGGAPCDDGSGCPFNEITAFEVFAGEAYTVDNFVAGGTYTFSMCNGPGAGSWTPNFTIIAPSGAIDAWGPGDGCSITWTATEDGTYFIVINEAGNCGVANAIGNGYPALTCEGGPEVACNTDCEAGAISAPDGLEICPVDTKTIANNSTVEIPSFGGYRLEVSINGNTYYIPVSDPSDDVDIDNDLGGIVSGEGDEPLVGVATIIAQVYSDDTNPNATICSESNELSFTFYEESDPFCTNSVSDLYIENRWSMFPNPTNSELTIQLNTEHSDELMISIYDLSGRLVFEQKNVQLTNSQNATTIDVSTLNQGVYQVVLSNQNMKTTKQLVISK